jgi:hypothetical protein
MNGPAMRFATQALESDPPSPHQGTAPGGRRISRVVDRGAAPRSTSDRTLWMGPYPAASLQDADCPRPDMLPVIGIAGSRVILDQTNPVEQGAGIERTALRLQASRSRFRRHSPRAIRWCRRGMRCRAVAQGRRCVQVSRPLLTTRRRRQRWINTLSGSRAVGRMSTTPSTASAGEMPCPAVKAVMVSRLDRCRDQVIDGFKRYAALAVVARNLQHIGALLLAQEAETARGARESQHRRPARPCRSGWAGTPTGAVRLHHGGDASHFHKNGFGSADLAPSNTLRPVAIRKGILAPKTGSLIGHDSTQALRRRPGHARPSAPGSSKTLVRNKRSADRGCNLIQVKVAKATPTIVLIPRRVSTTAPKKARGTG